MKKPVPFHKRKFLKVKNAKRNFLCALCRAPREMRYEKNLNRPQYIQIFVLSGFLMWCLYPFMGVNSGIVLFVVWPTFEMLNKFLYRKEVSCPYCGFDATWYRRDVRVARQKVKAFWSQAAIANNPPVDVEPKSRPTAHS